MPWTERKAVKLTQVERANLAKYLTKTSKSRICFYTYKDNGSFSENLSMDTPQLLSEWTPEELEAQRARWREVSSLSEQISISARASDWQSLLPLAVKRQTLIDDFFKQPICLPLFHAISEQLGAMQEQHEVVAKLISQAIENNESKSAALSHTRHELANLAQQH